MQMSKLKKKEKVNETTENSVHEYESMLRNSSSNNGSDNTSLSYREGFSITPIINRNNQKTFRRITYADIENRQISQIEELPEPPIEAGTEVNAESLNISY